MADMTGTTTKPVVSKLDLRREYKEFYGPPPRKVVVVDVPELQFISLDGVIAAGINPAESDEFHAAMEAMYGVGYGLKFMSKLREKNPIDFTVMALEALWSVPSGGFDFQKGEPWEFTLLMMQPDHIDQKMFEDVVAQTATKRPNRRLDDLSLVKWREGPSIQIMHIGPYSEEAKTIALMETYAEEHGYRYRGRHHEIYLGDPTRAKPENLKTILRQPVHPG